MSLERLYMTSCETCGVTRDELSEEAMERHIQRYKTVGALLADRVRSSDRIVDVGCGSGYGLNILSDMLSNVRGVDISPDARAYTKHHYPNLKVFPKVPPCSVVAMVESMEHMDVEAFREYVSKARILVITTPLCSSSANPHHVTMFSSVRSVLKFMAQNFPGVTASEYVSIGPIKFTCGSIGKQFIGIFQRGS